MITDWGHEVVATGALLAMVFAVSIWPGPRGPRDHDDVPAHEPSAEGDTAVAGGVDGANEDEGHVGDAADAVLLLALALRSGRSVIESIDLVAELCRGRVRDDLRRVSAAHRWGLSDDEAWATVGPDWAPAATAWMASNRAGVAPADLLMSAAIRMHEVHDETMAARIQRAAVLLVLPLGGLFLPGFVATTVVPLVLHMLRSQGG